MSQPLGLLVGERDLGNCMISVMIKSAALNTAKLSERKRLSLPMGRVRMHERDGSDTGPGLLREIGTERALRLSITPIFNVTDTPQFFAQTRP